jgi:hypothetical protein
MIMAQGRSYLPDEMIFETIFFGDGREVSISQYETHGVVDGKQVAKKTTQALKLEDGRCILANQLYGPKAVIVGRCSACIDPPPGLWHRTEPSHGLASLDRMKQCVDCGVRTCPRHTRRSAYDHRHRCPKCAKTHWYRCLLRRIFTERVPDRK